MKEDYAARLGADLLQGPIDEGLREPEARHHIGHDHYLVPIHFADSLGSVGGVANR